MTTVMDANHSGYHDDIGFWGCPILRLILWFSSMVPWFCLKTLIPAVLTSMFLLLGCLCDKTLLRTFFLGKWPLSYMLNWRLSSARLWFVLGFTALLFWMCMLCLQFVPLVSHYEEWSAQPISMQIGEGCGVWNVSLIPTFVQKMGTIYWLTKYCFEGLKIDQILSFRLMAWAPALFSDVQIFFVLLLVSFMIIRSSCMWLNLVFLTKDISYYFFY